MSSSASTEPGARAVRRRARQLLQAVAVALTCAVSISVGGAAASAAVSGPDVSSYQHPNGYTINWTAAKVTGGAAFAFVKATEGTTYTNPYFARDWAALSANKMVRGAYHYGRPTGGAAGAIAQARKFVSVAGTLKARGDLPGVLDLEVTDGQSAATIIAWTRAYLTEVKRLTGRTPIMYTYPNFWQTKMGNTTGFTGYPLWIATYGARPILVGGWSRYTFWQYTSSARLAGMSGPVDMSVYNGTLAQLWALAGGGPAAPVAPPAPKPVPSAPVSLAATPGAGTVTLTWAPPIVTGGGLTAYTVTVSGRPAQRLPATATSFTATGLKPAALQSFAVAAVNANGTGPVVTTAAVPLVPTRVALTPSVATVNSGARHQVVAAVTRTDTGAAIAGSPVTVHVVARAGASPAPYAVTTDAAGRATISVTPAATSDITVSLPQSATLWTSAAAATVAVAPSLTVALSAASVRAGGIVTLSGTTGRENAGQTAVTQWYERGKWFTGVGMKVAANGTFSVRVRPMKKMTLTYRLVLGATAGHNAAISRTVVLKVV